MIGVGYFNSKQNKPNGKKFTTRAFSSGCMQHRTGSVFGNIFHAYQRLFAQLCK